MAENTLPFQYQSQIDAATRRRMLAEALQKQALGFSGAQGGGRIAAKTSPLTWIANTATGYLAGEAADKRAKTADAVRGEAEKARRAEMAALLAAPEDARDSLGSQAQFSETQKLAETLFNRKQGKIKAFAETVKDRDNQTAANAVLTGQLPGGDYQSPALPQPKFGRSETGTPFVQTTNLKGETSVQFEPKGVTVNNQIPGNEGAMSLNLLQEQLKPRQERADAGKSVIAATNRAVDALERGAKAGGLEGQKQAIRKAAQGFGIELPSTAQTDELAMALGAGVLAEVAKLRPASDTDIKILRDIVGQIGSDPQALTRALAFGQAIALKDLGDFNSYLKEQGGTVQNDLARQRLAGAGVGYEMPGRLFGPLPFQMEVLRSLQRSGGDLSSFRLPDGSPIPPNAEFDIRTPNSGFPAAGGQAKSPQSWTPPPGWDALTPAQQARYKQLKGIQ